MSNSIKVTENVVLQNSQKDWDSQTGRSNLMLNGEYSLVKKTEICTIWPANTGDTRDMRLIPGSGRSPGGGHGNPLQDSCLGDPMDRGAWRATIYMVAKRQTRLGI